MDILFRDSEMREIVFSEQNRNEKNVRVTAHSFYKCIENKWKNLKEKH